MRFKSAGSVSHVIVALALAGALIGAAAFGLAGSAAATGTITQSPPTSGTVTTAASSAFTDQLTTTDTNTVTFATTVSSTEVTVSSSGAISTTGTLSVGGYTVSGTDSDSLGDTGSWTYTLTVTPATIGQSAPTKGMVTVPASSAFTAQLTTTDTNTVTFTTTVPAAGIAVSSSGAISVTSALAAGAYLVTGTDSDTLGNAGTWRYTLTVGEITQSSPTTGFVLATASAAFTGQLTAAGGAATVTYATTVTSPGLHVSSSGAISTTGALLVGTYLVTGTDTDGVGDSGTWTYTLAVTAAAITQTSLTTGSATAPGSSSFTSQITTSGNATAVAFTTSVTSTSVTVSSSGAVSTTGALTAGNYTVSGKDSDTLGDAGTWTYTLTVGKITQGLPTSNWVSPSGSATFTGQLTTTGNAAAVTFATTVSSTSVAVSSTGAVSTSGSLSAGAYTVSGTDSDGKGDAGTWTYTLSVGSITQVAPTSNIVTVPGSAAFTDQLATTDTNAVTFVTIVTSPSISVSSSGAVSTTGSLSAGAYTVSGSDSDSPGDVGTWTYTLTVGKILESSLTTGTVTTTGSAGFTAQLATTGSAAAATYVTTQTALGVTVSSSGLISTTGTLWVGNFVLAGTDSDGVGDSGTWTYTLNVTPVTITGGAPIAGTVTTTESAWFTDQLAATGFNGGPGSLTFYTTVSVAGVTITDSGAISTDSTLAAGTYELAGRVSDAYSDTGAWTYALTVLPVTLTQTSATASTIRTTASASFTEQLTADGPSGAITFATTARSAGLLVSPSGLISTTGTLAAGTYTASGIDGDAYGDTPSTWTYTLTINKVSSATTLGLNTSKIAYGDEEVLQMTVTLAQRAGFTPTGVVFVSDSTRRLCALRLSAGKGSCSLSAKQLALGTYSIVATYGGNGVFDGSSSKAHALIVAKTAPPPSTTTTTSSTTTTTTAPTTTTTTVPTKQVTFTGSYSGPVTVLIQDSGVTIPVVGGTGTGTLVGASTVSGENGTGSTTCTPFSGSGTIASAQGTIDFTVSGTNSTNCPTSQGTTSVTVDFSGTATATGGSGAAAGASGVISFTGSITLPGTTGSEAGTYTATLSGTLTVNA